MMKRFFIFIVCASFIAPAKPANLATIGGSTRIITKSTSCDAKNWENSPLNACACCLTKEKTTSSENSEKIIKTCGKYCPSESLDQLALGQKNPDDIMTVVLWNTLDTPTVKISSEFLDKNGKLTDAGIIPFLTSLNNLRDLNKVLQKDFTNKRCLKAKDLGSGGVNTAQLFLISVDKNCASSPPALPLFMAKYIVKGTKKGVEEIKSLRLLHHSELKSRYDLLSPTRAQDHIAISFDELNLKYAYKKSNNYLTFLTVAPGKSLMSMSKELAAAVHKGDTAEIHKNSDQLKESFFSLGKRLGELHRYFMEKGEGGKLLGKSVVHGDLHLENVYADPTQNYLITLIDNESFAESLREKRPVAIDLFILYSFTVAQLKSQYRYPKGINLITWDNFMLKPLLQGYASNWPPSDHGRLFYELKEIFTNPKTVLKLLSHRSLFINLVEYQTKISDVKRIFNDLS